MPLHGSERGRQQAAGTVGMAFTGFEHGLFADNTFAVYNFFVVQGIKNLPVTGHQLNRIFTVVFNGDMIAKGKVQLIVFEVGTFKTSCY